MLKIKIKFVLSEARGSHTSTILADGTTEDINFVLLGSLSAALVDFLFLIGFSGGFCITALRFGSATTRGTTDLANIDGSGGGSNRA